MAQDSPVAVLYDANGNPLVSTVGTPAVGVLSTQLPDNIGSSTALGAVNAAATLQVTGRGAGFQLAAGTLIGTLVSELSFDGGTTWYATYMDSQVTGTKVTSVAFAASNTAYAGSIGSGNGVSHVRLRVSAYTSGTANVVLRASQSTDQTTTFAGAVAAALPVEAALVAGSDGTLLRPVSTDTSGRPNVNVNTLPALVAGSATIGAVTQAGTWAVNAALQAGTNSIGAVTQGGTWTMQPGNTPNTTPWLATVNQGGNSAVVKAASTAPAAADPALVVAVSPNGAQSTAALQTTGNSSLAQIVTNTAATAVDFTSSGSITASGTGAGSFVAITGQGVYTVTVSITGTWVATLIAEGQLADSTWVQLPFYQLSSTPPFPPLTSTSANGSFMIVGGGYQQIRIRSTAYTSGTVAVALEGSLAQQSMYCGQMGPWSVGLAAGSNNIGSVNVAAQQDITTTGTLGALNAAIAITAPGQASFGFQLTAGTLIGTLVAEVSYDGGTNWWPTLFDNPSTDVISSTIVFSAANALTAATIVGVGGVGMFRVRVSAYTSGTANAMLRAAQVRDPSTLFTGPAGLALPPEAAVVGGTDPGALTRAMSVDAVGRPNVNCYTQDNYVPTYAVTSTWTPVGTAPTDICIINGSATKTIRVLRIRLTSTQTTAGTLLWLLVKRSTANSGGTATTVTGVPYNSVNAAATAVFQTYTANPTVGTTVGTVRQRKAFVGTTTTVMGQDETIWDFPSGVGSALILRGTAEGAALSLGGTAYSGLSVTAIIEFSEQ